MSFNFMQIFLKNGFVELDNIFSEEEIENFNKKINPLIEKNFVKSKTDIEIEYLTKSGVTDDVLSNKHLRKLILEIMPDPVLYQLNVYEVDNYKESTHTNNNALGGWHSDLPNFRFLYKKNPHYFSIIIYLTDVLQDKDGPFEITDEFDINNINHNTRSIKILGKKGTSFIWNNNYIHRACPNSGAIRRRVLKIGFQNNYLQNSLYPRLINIYRDLKNKDEFTDFIFGKFYMNSIKGPNLHYLLKDRSEFNKFKKSEFNSKIELSMKTRINKLIKKIIN